MFISKRILFGILSVVVLFGVVGLLTPPAEQAAATGFFGKFKKGKCDVPPTWGEIIHGTKRWVKKWGGAAY